MSQQYSQLDGTEVIQMYGSSKLTTTAAIAALGGSSGGGFINSEMYVSSGLNGPAASLGMFVGWQSATVGSKTQLIPKSTGSRQVIVVADLQGTASNAAPITATPVSGPAVLNGQGVVYTPGGTMTLLDTAAGWVEI
jgi:hypothetical protein